MILLHRRSGKPLILNADLIETVEADDGDETVIMLTTGNVVVVSETPEAVAQAALGYRRSIATAPR